MCERGPSKRSGSSMSLPGCKTKHRCVDGGEGECSQPHGHHGRHLCRSCLSFFSSGEAIHSVPPDETRVSSEPDQKRAPDVRPQDEGDGTTHWHCAHCNRQIPLNSPTCVLCGYKICYACSEANCPKTERVRPQDEGDGTTHWHCAHCNRQIPLSSPTCVLCGYKICYACSEVNCPKTARVRTQDATCSHCRKSIPEHEGQECDFCGEAICGDCITKEYCPAPRYLCGHCGKPLRNEEWEIVCRCGRHACLNCQSRCPGPMARNDSNSRSGDATK